MLPRVPKNLTFGFKATLPITPGVIPFAAVMGTVCADAHLSFFQSVAMNVILYAGASQLAAVDLMTKHSPVSVVVATGLIINLRFLLYSAAFSPVVQHARTHVKLASAFFLTDQNYAVMCAHENRLRNNREMIEFYFGSVLCITVVWQSSMIAGYIFGNFAPASWSLDYAVPLSFITLMIPTLKNAKYVAVALFSSVVAILLKPIPYNLGLIVTALLAIALGVLLSRKKQ